MYVLVFVYGKENEGHKMLVTVKPLTKYKHMRTFWLVDVSKTKCFTLNTRCHHSFPK